MAILLIGEAEQAAITAAIERARRRPVMLDAVRASAMPDKPVVKLADRAPGWRRPGRPEQVLIPIGYRAMVSFEEQPAGMCMHLSVSVERADPTLMPSEASVSMIAEAFGIKAGWQNEGRVWIEEYEPGRHAVNIVVLTGPQQEGHA